MLMFTNSGHMRKDVIWLTIGQKIRQLRGDMTQEKAASLIGVTKTALSMYENDERVPRDEIKKRIATVFGQTVGAIFYDE